MQIKNNIKTIIKPREQTSAFFLPKHSVCLVYWDPVTLHIREVWSGLIVLLSQLLLACAFLWGKYIYKHSRRGRSSAHSWPLAASLLQWLDLLWHLNEQRGSLNPPKLNLIMVVFLAYHDICYFLCILKGNGC